MNYDEDLLVELIAGGDVSQTEIAERVGVSRRTVWLIANGHSRPDLQQKIADTVEGYRQAAIRLAARFMKPLLKKQIEVALEGDGEISRRCREFLLKTFMIELPRQAARSTRLARSLRLRSGSATGAGEQDDAVATGMNLMELSPDLKEQVVKELGGPDEERKPVIGDQSLALSEAEGSVISEPFDDAPVEGAPLPSPVATPSDKRKKVADPFDIWVDGPHGKKVYAHTIRAIEEAKAEEAAMPIRRRVPRVPRE